MIEEPHDHQVSRQASDQYGAFNRQLRKPRARMQQLRCAAVAIQCPGSLHAQMSNPCRNDLLFLEQRLSLSVFVDNSTALEWVLTDDAREADQDRENEQNAHDDKGEDPLECDDVSEELGNTEGCRNC